MHPKAVFNKPAWQGECHSQLTVPPNKQREGSLIGHTEGGNRREEDRLPRLEGTEWQGLLSCLQRKGGKNRRQNLRFFVSHHSPYILHSNGAQTTLSLGQVLGTRISSQVRDLPKGEDKITKRDKITCPDKMIAQCGTTLLSGLGGQTWQALVVPTVARKTVTATDVAPRMPSCALDCRGYG